MACIVPSSPPQLLIISLFVLYWCLLLCHIFSFQLLYTSRYLLPLLILWASGMDQWIKPLAAKPGEPSSLTGIKKWRERIKSYKLSSDLRTGVVVHVGSHTHTHSYMRQRDNITVKITFTFCRYLHK